MKKPKNAARAQAKIADLKPKKNVKGGFAAPVTGPVIQQNAGGSWPPRPHG
jgi:hypothetical protein